MNKTYYIYLQFIRKHFPFSLNDKGVNWYIIKLFVIANSDNSRYNCITMRSKLHLIRMISTNFWRKTEYRIRKVKLVLWSNKMINHRLNLLMRFHHYKVSHTIPQSHMYKCLLPWPPRSVFDYLILEISK